MSNKEIVADLLGRLPANASLHDIAREIEFVAGVSEGFESHEHEGGVNSEDVRARATAWAKASGVDGAAKPAWWRAAAASDAFAFLADPAEDIYTPEDGEPLRDAK